jgi:poly-gamma-glutamate capsule biosynthesis protein CapA/YwtB (metallophosphatase superfamily)
MNGMRERGYRAVKRFFFLVFPLFGAFLFFSFLSRTDTSLGRQVVLLVDGNMSGRALVAREIGTRLARAGFKVSVGAFDAGRLDQFIIANPGALFLSDRTVQSDRYALKRTDHLFAAVAVTGRSSGRYSLTGAEFDRIAESDGVFYGTAEKAVAKRNGSVLIVPFDELSLRVKPLAVDGVFPSFRRMKDGSYPKIFRYSVYTREGRDLDAALAGSWISKSFSIIAGGDIMLARGTGQSVDRHGVDHPFEKIRTEMTIHDIACANLEGPISDRGRRFLPDKGIYFRADPKVIKGIVDSGLDFLSLANNHSLDWGVDALADTMSLLKTAGIRYAGAGRTREEALSPAVFRMGDKSVAFIAYNDVYPLSVSEERRSMQTLDLREGEIEKEIRLLKKKYDILIVSVHAGAEYNGKQEEEKTRKLRSLVDAGADVVLGHHPHVVQDIEIYRGRVVAYSLGNLIFDQSWSEQTSQGLLLEIGFVGQNPVYINPMPVVIERAQAQLAAGVLREEIVRELNSNN